MLWYGHDLGWWGYVGMAIGMGLFWLLVAGGITALVIFVFADRQTQGPPPGAADPAHILADRFARGEISESEYRDRIAALHDAAHR